MFDLDAIYNRSTLHDEFGGTRQAGISPSAKHPYIFLFTGHSGEQHGYHDGWVDTNIFRYFGEGQLGHQSHSRGNLAIQLHEERGKQLHLFQKTSPAGYVRYIGEFRYHHHFWKENNLDTDGNPRDALVFELHRVN